MKKYLCPLGPWLANRGLDMLLSAACSNSLCPSSSSVPVYDLAFVFFRARKSDCQIIVILGLSVCYNVVLVPSVSSLMSLQVFVLNRSTGLGAATLGRIAGLAFHLEQRFEPSLFDRTTSLFGAPRGRLLRFHDFVSSSFNRNQVAFHLLCESWRVLVYRHFAFSFLREILWRRHLSFLLLSDFLLYRCHSFILFFFLARYCGLAFFSLSFFSSS